jgi:very-short-patch-repair endonuclease
MGGGDGVHAKTQVRSSHHGAIGEWLYTQPIASVRALFSDDVRAATAAVTERTRMVGAAVVCTFTELQSRDEVMSHLVEVLADGAAARWPLWYGQSFSNHGTGDDALASPGEIAAVLARRSDVLERWLVRASSRARGGARPLLPDLLLGVQARQLAIALDDRQVRLVVATLSATPEADLAGFARALEWFADQTRARVVCVLPIECSDRQALDRIAYQSTALRFADPSAGDEPVQGPGRIVQPVLGRPHPLSRVEQRLAQVLGQAGDLGVLFEFNQRIQTARGAHAIVDLLWRAGRVIVEIDGWDTHGNRCAFASDRHRDYELVISGYLVLRLTNEEVIADAAKAIDKIRDVVKFRRIDQVAI